MEEKLISTEGWRKLKKGIKKRGNSRSPLWVRWCPSQKDPIKSLCRYDHGKKMHRGIMEIRACKRIKKNIALENLIEYQRKGRSHPGQRKHFPDGDILDPEGSLMEISSEDLLVQKGSKCFIKISNLWKSWNEGLMTWWSIPRDWRSIQSRKLLKVALRENKVCILLFVFDVVISWYMLVGKMDWQW